MAEFYDPSFVESGVFSPDSMSKQNAGLLHNHYLYITYKTRFNLGADPDLNSLLKEIETRTIDLEEQDLLPDGSISLIREMNKFLSKYSEKTFQPGIDHLAGMYRSVLVDPKFRDSNLVIAFSIAYYSSVFWSEMQVVPDGGEPEPLRIPRWLKIVAGDVLGALAGIGTGALIGGVGAVIGGVLGGCSGSILEAG